MADLSRVGSEGLLVGDQRTEQILLLQDLNGDGFATDPQEISVYFDNSNNSGLESPTTNVFSLHQGEDGTVFVGDGHSDAVYRLHDRNGDGDAQDYSEAQIWFSSENGASLPLVTPNGIWHGSKETIFIANAGTPIEPMDAVYRTVDLNGDGDANDVGEATKWLDLAKTETDFVPFSIGFDGEVAFLSNLAGTLEDSVYRLEDQDGDGLISLDEYIPFISTEIGADTSVNIASLTVSRGAVHVLSWEPLAGNTIRLYKLEDLDGSKQIDHPIEMIEVWNSLTLPSGTDAEIAYSLASNQAGELSITANSFNGTASVLRLKDANGDGDYLDKAETVIFGSSTTSDQLIKPRAIEFYEPSGPLLASKGEIAEESGILLLALTLIIKRLLPT